MAINITTSISNSSSNFSNFTVVDYKIYFAIGNTVNVIVLDVLDPAIQTQQYPELPECTQIYAYYWCMLETSIYW